MKQLPTLILLLVLLCGCNNSIDTNDNMKDDNSIYESSINNPKKRINDLCVKWAKSVLVSNNNHILFLRKENNGYIAFLRQEYYVSSSDTPDHISLIRKNNQLRKGDNIGENVNWVYGSIDMEYQFLNEDITDESGIILGNQEFILRIKTKDISSFFPEKVESYIEGKYYRAYYDYEMNVFEISTITNCNNPEIKYDGVMEELEIS